jgi:hydroxypyruvate isomerase
MNRRIFNQLIVGTALGQALPRAGAQTAASMPGESTSSAANFHFSIMLWTIDHKIPVEQCLEIAHEAGYNGVEFTGEYKKWSADQTRQLKAKMRSLGLVVDAMSGAQGAFGDPNGTEEFLAGFKGILPYAKDLECPKIILLSGKRIEGVPQATQRQACIDNLKRAVDIATKENVDIVIEPIDPLENPTIFLTSVADGFDIVRGVGSDKVKVLYDFYHEQRGAGNLLEKLEKNIDLVGLVHVADVPGRHEPGTGETDYLNIYRKLAELKYDKFIAMEYYPTSDPLQSLKTQRLVALQATRTSAGPYKLSM